MPRVFFAIAAVVVFASACGKAGGGDNPNSCEAIGTHYFEIVKGEIDKADGDAKKNAAPMRSLLPKMKTKMVAECKKDEWPEKTRKCLAAAKSASAGKSCWQELPAPTDKPKSGAPAEESAPKAAKPDPTGM